MASLPEFVKIVDLKDPDNGGHVYVLKGQRQSNSIVSHHHLAAIWDLDGQIDNADDFDKYLQRWSKLLNQSAKVQLGETAEAQH